MSNFNLSITLLSSIVLLILIYFVIKSNANPKQKGAFSFFSITVNIYVWGLLLSNTRFTDNIDLFINRAFFGFVPVFTYSISYLLSSVFENKINRRFIIRTGFLMLVSFFVGVSDYVVTGLQYSTETHSYSVVHGPLYYLYVGLLLFPIISSALRSYKVLKEGDLNTRARLVSILYTTLLVGILFISTNIAYPIIFKRSDLSGVAPIWVTLWVIGLFYSIQRYRLFDIRYLLGQIVYRLSLACVLFLLVLVIYLVEQKYEITFDFNLVLLSIFLVMVGLAFALEWLFTNLYSIVDKYLGIGMVSKNNLVNEGLVKLSLLLNVVDINSTMKDLLDKLFDSESFGLILYDKNSHSIIESTFEVPVKSDDIKRFDKSAKEFQPLRSLGHSIYKLKVAPNGGIYRILNINESIRVLIVLGGKKGLRAYTSNDIDLVENILPSLTAALNRAILYKSVQDFAKTLQQKVDEATMDLQEKNATLQQLRDRERDMMDIMGHELRTPLTIIKMTLGILKAKSDKDKAKFKPKEFEEYYKRLKEAADREVNLLETMLSSTKLDAKRMEIHMEKVDILPMIRDSILAHESKATDKGLKLEFEDPGKPVEVFADRIRLPEVVDNLINNAIKYTDKGYVKILLENDKKFLKFAVEDSGRGIPKEAISKLGTKFFRVKQHLEKVHNSDNSNNIVRPGGTGLGLYVTFGLLELMGGKINVESELGKGSTFTAYIQRYLGQQEEGAVESHKDIFARLGLSKEEVLKERAKSKRMESKALKAAKAELHTAKETEEDSKALSGNGSSNADFYKKLATGQKDSGKSVTELLEEK